ncbi:MAG: hypothetical protein H0W66_10105 [Chthoniobacterales bacterium]|nr:hypothetical protein [Chthoniobacterales bacterium]
MQRDFKAAEKVIDRALALSPQSFSLWALKSQLAFQETGDLSVAEEGFADFDQARASGKLREIDPAALAEVTLAKANVLTLQKKYPEALALLRQIPRETRAGKAHELKEVDLLEGIALEGMGQKEAAQAAFRRAKEEAEAILREAPNDAPRHASLGRMLAWLGEKDAAIAEAKRAVELLPASVDAFSGPQMQKALAEVYALTGENAQAIALLDELLSRPSDVTVAALKLDPAMRRLRDDPEFQKPLAKRGRSLKGERWMDLRLTIRQHPGRG